MASEPRYVTLPQLFQGHLFRVPDYQRGYAWTEQQLDDLWTDIELLDPRTQHFTGMIVVEKRGTRHHDREMQDYKILEVIDGQQRLTTLVLLLLSIIREMEAAEDNEVRSQAALLRGKYIGTDGWHRLALNDDSRTYFDHILSQGDPLTRTENGSQQNLFNAVRYFRHRLTDLGRDPNGRVEALRSLVSRLQSNLRFVFYEVDDDAEAGLIFEVMNNRGKELSQADRLKNYLMYLAHKVGLPAESVKDMSRQWGEVFKQVMRASPDGSATTAAEARLLRNHWILYKEAQAPKELRGLSISQRIRHEMLLEPVSEDRLDARNERLRQKATAYTGSLVTTAHHYAEVFNPASPGALDWVDDGDLREAIRRELLSFHRMGHLATALPLLLAGRRRLKDTPELFLDLARALSIYSWRVYGICNHRAHAGQNHFRRRARGLFAKKGARAVQEARELVDDIYGWAWYYGGDDELLEKLTESNFYGSHRSQEIRYLFFEYEVELCHGQDPALDWTTFANPKKTQVEHIWPGKLQWLGGSEKKHKKNVNRLGNLTITHFNQALGKKAFKDKRKTYAKSNLVIENSLQRHRKWGLGHIDRRERELIAFVFRRWPLPQDENDDADA